MWVKSLGCGIRECSERPRKDGETSVCLRERVCWCLQARSPRCMSGNRSANSAFCALFVFLVIGTSLWWTLSLCCRENCYFSTSLFLLSSSHSIFLTRSSVILTLLLSPLLFSNLVSMRMLNLGRNDTYGVTRGKSGPGRGWGSESREQISVAATETRWAPFHHMAGHLPSTLQRQGGRVQIRRSSISHTCT